MKFRWASTRPPELKSFLQPSELIVDGAIGTDQRSRLSAMASRLSEKQIFRFAVVAAILLYLASVATSWAPTPDSALYLMLGNNLASGEGYTLWGAPHAHVPPGYPVMLGTMQWLGLGEMVWLNLATVIMTLATGWFVFAALGQEVGRRLALLVVLSLALNHTVHMVGTRVLSDLPYMLTMWAGLWCYFSGLRSEARSTSWLTAGTILLLLGCGIRVTGIPIALSAALGLALQGRAEGKPTRVHAYAMIWIIAISGAALLGYCMILSKNGEVPTYLTASSSAFARSPMEWVIAPCLNFLKTGQSLAIVFTAQRHAALGLFVAILWIPTLIGMVLAVRRGQYLGACITAGYLLAVLLKRPLLPRYLLPLAPFLFLYYFQGIQWLVERRTRWRPYGRRVALTSLFLCTALNAPRTLVTVYRNHSTRGAPSERSLVSREEAADFLSDHASEGEKFIGNQEERMLSYLSGVASIQSVRNKHAVETITKSSLSRWKDQGVHFVVNCGKLPEIDRSVATATGDHFRVVFENDGYRILALQPPPMTPGVANASEHAQRR